MFNRDFKIIIQYYFIQARNQNQSKTNPQLIAKRKN